LRRRHAALTQGEFETLLAFNGVFAYHRWRDDDSVVVVLNPREERKNVRIPLGRAAGRAAIWEDALSGARFAEDGRRLALGVLPSGAGYVLLPLKGVYG